MVLGKFRKGLERTRNRISQALKRLAGDQSAEISLEALEEILYTADVGPLAGELLEEVEKKYKKGDFSGTGEMPQFLRQRLSGLVQGPDDQAKPLSRADKGPSVILIVGVNGSGKTTSVAKLVHWYQSHGCQVLVAAGDTFRAAAVEQLTIWCQRLNTELIRAPHGADPAAVAHDAAEAALARKADVLIVDTAGRLHTQKNLMQELEKVSRVISRKIDGAPHEILLVLDATTGQNAVQQARRFQECVPVSGLILAKLDGTAKGGAVLSVGRELKLPVKFVGLGEQLDDFEVFNPQEFVDALLEPQEA
ncbi:MAG: signal recognition particle-docking protein FtsY [Planctomycetota bacterium]|nr:MAG: signal recognition particle-docking protein FtsY [Planctomycetota bacterium]